MKSINKSVDPNTKSLKIIIQNKEYEINNNEILNILQPFLFKINNRNIYNPKKRFIIFPKNLDKESLDIFLSYLYDEHEKSDAARIQNNKIFDYFYMRKLFNVCIFLNSTTLIEKIIKKYICKISTQNCLDIITHLTDLIFNKKVQFYFVPIIRKAINFLALNLPEFIIKHKKEIYSLSNEIIEELIEIYLNSNNNKTDNNIRTVLDLLMHSRKISKDIFYLLENERKNCLKKFSSEINCEDSSEAINPKFIWKIKYTFSKNDIYLEKKINLEGLNIALIYYYQPNNDTCQLALQILDDNDCVINSEINENDLNNKKFSNIKVVSNFERDNFNTNNNLEKIENNIISIIYSCEIPELNFKSRINFNCIKPNNRSKFLIFRINNFMKMLSTNNNNVKINQEFSIKLYFSKNQIFSTIVSHIHNNIEQYHKYISIGKLPDSALQIIIDYNPKNDPKIENYKINYILNWLRENQNYPKCKIAHLFKKINWKIMTTNDLLDFLANNTKLLLFINELKNIIFCEIQRRFQEEYNQLYQNNEIGLFKNNYNSTTNINDNNYESQNNIYSFTFEFLTKILFLLDYKKNNILTESQKLIYCQSQNNTNSDIYNETKKINYTSPVQSDKRNLIKSISQRNFYNSQKHLTKYDKISKSIRLSPSCNNCLGLLEKSKKKTNINKNYNSSLNTDSQKTRKKFNNNSRHYNKSCDENIGYDEYFKKFLKKTNKKKSKNNNLLNKMIKNLNRINTPIIQISNQRIISTNKIENIMNIKPSKVQIVKPHSKSADKIINPETSNQNKKLNQSGNINIIPNVKTKENIIKNNIGLRCFITNQEWTKQLSSKQIENNINSEINKSGNPPMIFNKKLDSRKRSCENI